MQYARSLRPDKIFILSAKYGLLDLDEEIDPYNKTLNMISTAEIKNWADLVVSQLQNMCDLNKDEFIFLAGNNYRKFLIPYLKNYRIPLQGLGIGKQLKWLRDSIKNG